MKQAVAHLVPYIEAERAAGGDDTGRRRSAGKIVMATVKGDVHDIGKNIVGVVLGCNDYEVIDLGVMVPVDEDPRDGARARAPTSSACRLITPSLEEMRLVAARDGARGPDDAAAHRRRDHVARRTPRSRWSRPTRARWSTSTTPRARSAWPARCSTRRRARRLRGRAPRRVRRGAARPRGAQRRRPARHRWPRRGPAGCGIDWDRREPPPPVVPGRARRWPTTPLEELVERIDWTPFFATWELQGRYPAHPRRRDRGHGRARALRRRPGHARARRRGGPAARRWRRSGFWPAGSTADDDIVVWADEARTTELARLHTLRQQMRPADRSRRTSPSPTSSRRVEAGVADYVGAFAVTAGPRPGRGQGAGSRPPTTTTRPSCSRRSPTGWPRPSPSGCTSACARELWGYAPDEALDNDALIAESYQGIRPAPGYPACPDHTEKATLFELLDAEERAGMRADRVDGHAAGGVGQRASTSRTPRRATSASAGSTATSSRTTPRARAGASSKPSAGWPPTSPPRPIAVRIRPFRADDERALVALWVACEPDPPVERSPARHRAQAGRHPASCCWSVRKMARVVGTVMAGYDGHRGWINYLGGRSVTAQGAGSGGR